MVAVSWKQLLALVVALFVGLIVGINLTLTVDQALNIMFALLGLVVGAVGVFASLWISTRDRELKMDTIHTCVSEVHRSIHALETMANQVWQPVIAGLSNKQQAQEPAATALSFQMIQLTVEQVAQRDEMITQLRQQVQGVRSSTSSSTTQPLAWSTTFSLKSSVGSSATSTGLSRGQRKAF